MLASRCVSAKNWLDWPARCAAMSANTTPIWSLSPTMSLEHELLRILGQKKVSTCFQPIFHSDGRSLYAYEALSRGPDNSSLHQPLQLFAQARQQQKLFALESICRTNAIKQFSSQRLPGKLFLNVTPETLLQPDHQRGLTLELVNNSGMSPDKVGIELPGNWPTNAYNLFGRPAVTNRQRNFSFAWADLGPGSPGFRLCPEF